MTPEIDVDAELSAWHEAQGPGALTTPKVHRCPPDMPPCPNCEAIIEEEDWNEFGAQ